MRLPTVHVEYEMISKVVGVRQSVILGPVRMGGQRHNADRPVCHPLKLPPGTVYF